MCEYPGEGVLSPGPESRADRLPPRGVSPGPGIVPRRPERTPRAAARRSLVRATGFDRIWLVERRTLVLTIDVEPDWGVEGWLAVEETVGFLVEQLGATGSGATCFTTGLLARERPGIVRELAQVAEIGSHGLSHRRLDKLPRLEVEGELRLSRDMLQDTVGEVLGVRAPFFATPPDWLDLARETGYRYDASRGFLVPSQGAVPWRDEPLVSVVNGFPVFAVGTMCESIFGALPMSLFYLRSSGPFWKWLLPAEPRLMFLHPHELSETAPIPFGGIKGFLLGRGRGRRARTIFSHILSRYRCISCKQFLLERGQL